MRLWISGISEEGKPYTDVVEDAKMIGLRDHSLEFQCECQDLTTTIIITASFEEIERALAWCKKDRS